MAKFFLVIIFNNLIVFNYELYSADKKHLKVENNIQIKNNYSDMLLLKENFKKYSEEKFNEDDRNNVPNEEISYKLPWLAFFLSFFLPTTGQLYNGDYTKALIQAALILTGGGLVVGTACVECGETTGLQVGLLVSGALLAFTGYSWSIIDAPTSANAHNARIKKTSGINVYSTEDNKYSLRFNKAPINKSYNLSLFVEL